MITLSMNHKQFCRALGTELRKIRESGGLSRQELADRSGISRTSIERYEAGADMPIITFIRLCVAMGQSCAETLERVFRDQG